MIFRGDVRCVFVVFIFITVWVSSNASSHYTNTWAVHIPNADQEKVTEIARRHGMINLGQVNFKMYKNSVHTLTIIARIQRYTKASLSLNDTLKLYNQVGSLKGYYHFKHRAYPRRMRRETIGHTSKLSREFKVCHSLLFMRIRFKYYGRVILD